MKACKAALVLAAALSTGACSVVGYPAPTPEPTPGEAGPSATAAGNGGELAASTDPVPRVEPRSRRGNASSYEVWGQVYYTIDSADGYDEEGLASWYGEAFAGRPTSNGEIFDPELLTAAHRSLPLPTWVEVTNLENGLEVVVRVNDRGPFHDTDRRIIDLSRAAAERIDLVRAGVARVRIRALEPDELQGGVPGREPTEPPH